MHKILKSFLRHNLAESAYLWPEKCQECDGAGGWHTRKGLPYGTDPMFDWAGCKYCNETGIANRKRRVIRRG